MNILLDCPLICVNTKFENSNATGERCVILIHVGKSEHLARQGSETLGFQGNGCIAYRGAPGENNRVGEIKDCPWVSPCNKTRQSSIV